MRGARLFAASLLGISAGALLAEGWWFVGVFLGVLTFLIMPKEEEL